MTTTAEFTSTGATNTKVMEISSVSTTARFSTVTAQAYTNITTSTTLPSTTDSAHGNSGDSKLPIIVGAAVGGGVALFVIIVVVVLIVRHRSRCICCKKQQKRTTKPLPSRTDLDLQLNPNRSSLTDSQGAHPSPTAATVPQAVHMDVDGNTAHYRPPHPQAPPISPAYQSIHTQVPAPLPHATLFHQYYNQISQHAPTPDPDPPINTHDYINVSNNQHQQPEYMNMKDLASTSNRHGDMNTNNNSSSPPPSMPRRILRGTSARGAATADSGYNSGHHIPTVQEGHE